MVKKYLDFIRESDLFSDFNSLGEWIESIYDDNEYVKNIVNRFIMDKSPDIRLSNAINTLGTKEKLDIKSQIDNYLKNGIKDKEVTLSTSTEILESINEISLSGKGIFTSFLKSLTALGHKENKLEIDKCPNDFLLFYFFEDLDSIEVKTIFSRFKSLLRYIEMIDYGRNEVSLFFGIKCDGSFEYGFFYDNICSPIGKFKLTNSVVKWIIQLESKSASSLKKEIVNLSYNDILTLGRIKKDMLTFNPGFHEKKSNVSIDDKVISFGYYGVGKWENGSLDESNLVSIKQIFIKWLLTKKWSDKVLISLVPQSFWLHINLKLK
jgi:hypothetical protein